MKSIFFLVGCGGVIVGAMFGLQLLAPLAAGNFDLDENRDEVIRAAAGGIIALICFGKALATRTDPTGTA
jgi:hypothetical protein